MKAQLDLALLPENSCSKCASPALFNHGGLSFCAEHGRARLREIAARARGGGGPGKTESSRGVKPTHAAPIMRP